MGGSFQSEFTGGLEIDCVLISRLCSDMIEKYQMNLPAYPENGDQIVEL